MHCVDFNLMYTNETMKSLFELHDSALPEVRRVCSDCYLLTVQRYCSTAVVL